MSWDDVKQSNGAGDFFSCVDGDNVVRIVSEPLKRVTHFVESEKRSYPCTGETGCAICGPEEKPNTKYLFYIIDRVDGLVKLAEFGATIANAVKKFRTMKDYEFDKVPGYDVIINKTGKGKDGTKYAVVAARQNSELTADERAAIDGLKPLEEVVAAIDAKAANPTQPVAQASTDINPEDLGIAQVNT